MDGHSCSVCESFIEKMAEDAGEAAAGEELVLVREQSGVVKLADLLGLGGAARINTPGCTEGNWRFRCTAAQLDALDTATYLYYNRLYGR